MKIELVRSDIRVTPAAPDDGQMVMIRNRRFYKCGAIIEANESEADYLIGNLDAKPADDESRALFPNWEALHSNHEAQMKREMLAKGIDPADRKRFMSGEILGYDEEGNDIPGPNWKGDE